MSRGSSEVVEFDLEPLIDTLMTGVIFVTDLFGGESFLWGG